MKSKHSNIEYPEVRIRDVAFSMWQGMSKSWFMMLAILFGIGGANAFEIVIPLYYKSFLTRSPRLKAKQSLRPSFSYHSIHTAT